MRPKVSATSAHQRMGGVPIGKEVIGITQPHPPRDWWQRAALITQTLAQAFVLTNAAITIWMHLKGM